MKTLLATSALAFAVLAGPPASAQVTYDPDGSARAVFAQATPQQTRSAAPRRTERVRVNSPDGRVHSINPAFDVYDTNGNYIGSDPDVAIRNELMRDPPGRGD